MTLIHPCAFYVHIPPKTVDSVVAAVPAVPAVPAVLAVPTVPAVGCPRQDTASKITSMEEKIISLWLKL